MYDVEIISKEEHGEIRAYPKSAIAWEFFSSTNRESYEERPEFYILECDAWDFVEEAAKWNLAVSLSNDSGTFELLKKKRLN